MRTGVLSPDWVFLNVSPPDKHGYCSLGVEVATALAAAESAKNIVAQVNPNVPRTHGQSSIHLSCIDYLVHVDEPLPEKAIAEPDDIDNRIAHHIAALVPDGSCLQMGIGAIPNAVLASLMHHKQLGVHTEMFQDGLIDLIDAGVVTNARKSYMRGRTVTSFVMGTKRLYDYVDDNPGVVFLDSAVTNDPLVIMRNSAVIAINAAVEVDLTGQVCADSIGTRHISGVGGQVDFERGAALSPHGVPIICLRSRTKHDERTIVNTLKPGAGVVTTRHHVHWVVTEWGAVNLFGLNFVQRAKALIEIAHPDDRETLEKEAFERFKMDVSRHR
jgi:acyl-CoA hydrolase